jgi:3-deoxy-manno-octulosonate cytidylyltransferase (CMP-KDO synthetase)
MKIAVIIPARMAASRFPGKPLVSIAGLPLVEHVRRRCLLAKDVTDVVVATCDEEIVVAVEDFGGRAVMTSDKHERCTERVAEAAEKIEVDIVVNAQGDEPLMLPEHIEAVIEPFSDPSVGCVSLVSPLESAEDFKNPGVVKAVLRPNGDLLYLSRAAVPHFQKRGEAPVFRETGIRALRKDWLVKYAVLPETPLERVEAVDMLRLLEHGFAVRAKRIEGTTMGVDYPEDVAKAEQILKDDPEQGKIFERIQNSGFRIQ